MRNKTAFKKILAVAFAVIVGCQSGYQPNAAIVYANEGIEQESVSNVDLYENNEILVKYKDSITTKEKQKSIKALDVTDTQNVAKDVQVVTVDEKDDLADTIDTLKEDPNVDYVQPNYTYELMDTDKQELPDDKYFDIQWALNNDGSLKYYDTSSRKNIKAVSGIDINILPAWKQMKENPLTNEVVVAVIDTGVDAENPDLVDNMWTNSLEVSGDGVDNDGNGYIDDINGWNFYDNNSQIYSYERNFYSSPGIKENEDDHGTHCAGTIAASTNNQVGMAGISGDANVLIMSVKALGGDSGEEKVVGTTSSVTKAIQYAESMGADICNFSFGGNIYDKYMKEIMEKSDMLFVCAAGNDGKDNTYTPIYPASYKLSNIISVANVTCDGTLAPSSNYSGKEVDIAAPGTRIAGPLVNRRYAYETGTSMAAPMVTGVAALLYAQDSSITAAAAKNILVKSAKKVDGVKGKVRANGIIDAYAALNYDNTSPAIKTVVGTVSGSYKKNLKIKATDTTGITAVKYAKGNYRLEDFENNTVGKSMDVSQPIQTITVSTSGTYSIYAVNNLGNGSLKTVKVTIKPPTSISLGQKSLSIKTGETVTLNSTIKPAGTNSKVSYKSSNAKIASVNQLGEVTAVKKGQAKITATTENGKKTTITINVSE